MAGGTKHTIATFPVGDKVSATDPSYSELQKQLGNVVDGDRGRLFRLVQATNADALTGRAKVYRYTLRTAYTVEIAASALHDIIGAGLTTQQSLAAGDLFWLQVAGEATLTDDGGTTAVGDMLDAAGTGDTVVNGSPVLGQTFARAVTAAVAHAEFQADLLFTG